MQAFHRLLIAHLLFLLVVKALTLRVSAALSVSLLLLKAFFPLLPLFEAASLLCTYVPSWPVVWPSVPPFAGRGAVVRGDCLCLWGMRKMKGLGQCVVWDDINTKASEVVIMTG